MTTTKAVHQQRFFIHRNRNKELIRKTMNNLDWEANNDQADLANQSKYSMEQLKAMQLVAKMKEAADKVGAGFVGGFITPSGQRFMMSNVDADDIQHRVITHQLDSIQQQAVENAQSFFDNFQNNIKIIEGPDGIEIKIEPDAE
jgi:hypothetical protein